MFGTLLLGGMRERVSRTRLPPPLREEVPGPLPSPPPFSFPYQSAPSDQPTDLPQADMAAVWKGTSMAEDLRPSFRQIAPAPVPREVGPLFFWKPKPTILPSPKAAPPPNLNVPSWPPEFPI